MMKSVQDDQALLSRLQTQQVEFVIIGGFCATMHGVSLVTRDLDVCCSFALANLRRLEAAVKDLHPYHRLAANKLPLELTDELCGRLNNLYLQTDLGRLDCLSEVKGVGSYEDALEHSVVFTLSYGEFRILDVDTLIAAKEAVGREHDLAAVKQLRAIKENLTRKAPQPKPTD
jgi:hypothetical protein